MDEKVVGGSYRVRLATEMRKAIRPLMMSWGFDHPPKDSPDWFGSTRLNTWVRERDGFTDEIYFTWSKYGTARYAMGMVTDQLERMLPPGHALEVVQSRMLPPGQYAQGAGRIRDIDILDRRLYVLGGLIDIDFEWSSGRRFLRDEIAHAIQRLKEANHYLLTGEASRHIRRMGASRTATLLPIYWHRQGKTGEANRRLHEEQKAKRAAKQKAGAEVKAGRPEARS